MSKKEKTKTATSPSRRLKIWEVEQCYLCSIVGTCLSVVEMKKVTKKLKGVSTIGLTDYDLHSTFIDLVKSFSDNSRVVNKALDKKYQLSVRQVGRAKSAQDLLDFWEYGKENDRMAGSYWAIMTHPATTGKVIKAVYGEVHMQSHQACCSNRRLAKKVRELQDKEVILKEALQVAHNDSRIRSAWQQEEIAELKLQVEKFQALETLLKKANDKIQALEQGAEVAEFKETISQLQADKVKSERTISRLKEALNTISLQHEKISKKNEQLSSEIDESRHENHTLQSLLQTDNVDCKCQGCEESHCPGPDLCGRRLLYVGGKPNMVPHYRKLVESRGGKFIHHDGGKEEQRTSLCKMLVQADAVICPINCVSHDACLRAKRFCKSSSKPFVTMRSAGLSALARGLEQIAHNTPANQVEN